MDKQKIHDDLVDDITLRLERKGYESILNNYNYHLGGKEGELDIFTYRNGYYNYYEIKGRHGKCQMNKAKKQLKRWQESNPGLETRLIYCALRKDGSLKARRVR